MITPGSIIITFTPNCPSSYLSDSERPSTANFELTYAVELLREIHFNDPHIVNKTSPMYATDNIEIFIGEAVSFLLRFN
ncbi:MAG: hypothetical protein VXY27_02945, partial [Thermoproteota archaeon]|nr:hypothetical protein [Thermoproteota archaeon]